jgi:hypothetical protein
VDTEPPEFTRVQFPVKALKLLLHELQSNGEVATLAGPTAAPINAESDDGVRTYITSPGIFKWLTMVAIPKGL